MQIMKEITRQLRSVMPFLIRLYLPVLMILVGIGVLRLVGNIEIGTITRDPAHITGAHPFTGLLSNIGILCWCSSAAICFFCSKTCQNNENREFSSFLFFAALITSLLLIDDFFLFHEIIFPKDLHINEKLVYTSYLIIAMSFLIAFRDTILQTEYVILFFSFAFLGLSILFDILPVHVPGHLLFEDGFKFLGIVTWLSYFVRVCFNC